jgi:hypothetical protein
MGKRLDRTNLLGTLVVASSAVLLTACSGDIFGGRGIDPNAPYDPNAPLVCDDVRSVEAPLRRLTSAQLENMVHDLFGGLVAVDADMPVAPGLGSSGFSTDPDANPASERALEAQLEAAEEVAVGVVGALEALLPCARTSPGEDCAERFIDTYAERAMRRPLTGDVRSELLAAYRLGSGDGFDEGIAALVTHLFLRPEVIFVLEHGKGTTKGGLELTSYEIATRLSLLFFDSIPDEELWEAARSGALDGELEAQAERMLRDARARSGLGRFVREWAQLQPLSPDDKDSSVYPGFDASLARSMEEELVRFSVDVFQNGTLSDFYASPKTFVDANMASFYGVESPPSGWHAAHPDPQRRLGVLGRPALLASFASAREGSYIHRGRFVLQQALCQPIPAPPLDALAQNPEFPADASNREMSMIRRSIPACAGCHERLDGIGLAFDEFGAIGEYRTVDSRGNAVDTSGQLLAGVDIAGSFDGVAELAQNLSISEDARACMSMQWFRFAFSRRESGHDLCAVQDIDWAFRDAGGDFASLVSALASTDAFRTRRLSEEK